MSPPPTPRAGGERGDGPAGDPPRAGGTQAGAPGTGDGHEGPHPGSTPSARVKGKSRFSPIWFVPIFAVAVAAYLVYTTLAKHGPTITITFKTADGLTADQTQVKHKNVSLGTVEDISLSKDMSHVIVHIRMDRTAKPILTDHARFWVVRPRLSPAAISGLETLVSGAFIEVDPGAPGGHARKDFEGLEDPPGVRTDEPGRVFYLKADRLGSLAKGAPVFFRDASVGEMLSDDLGDGKGPVTLRIFVRAPYDKFVHPDTHFFNTSGLSITTGAQGIRVELESIQSLISGGISFETPPSGENTPPSENDATFQLYENKALADGNLYKHNIHYVTYFQSSVQGLATDSAVQIFGVQVGVVHDVRLVNDAQGRAVVRVSFDLQPERVTAAKGDANVVPTPDTMRALVTQGLRVVLDSNNFITGQKVLALRYVPGSHAAEIGQEGDAMVVPSQPGGFENITIAAGEIVNKINQIPFEDIGKNLNATLRSLDQTVGGPDLQNAIKSLNGTLQSVQHLAQNADKGLAPALDKLPQIADQLQQAVQRANGALGEAGYGQNSEFQHNIERVMNQVNETMRTVRLLADFLDRHPEALIRGRGTGAGEK